MASRAGNENGKMNEGKIRHQPEFMVCAMHSISPLALAVWLIGASSVRLLRSYHHLNITDRWGLSRVKTDQYALVRTARHPAAPRNVKHGRLSSVEVSSIHRCFDSVTKYGGGQSQWPGNSIYRWRALINKFEYLFSQSRGNATKAWKYLEWRILSLSCLSMFSNLIFPKENKKKEKYDLLPRKWRKIFQKRIRLFWILRRLFPDALTFLRKTAGNLEEDKLSVDLHNWTF